REAELALQFAVVEHRVLRATGRRRVARSRNRQQLGHTCSARQNGLRKSEPCGTARCREMVEPAAFDECIGVQPSAGKIPGDRNRSRFGNKTRRSGRAKLVIDDLEFLAFSAEAQHRQEEIPAARTIYPACSENEMRSGSGHHSTFTGKFGASIA